MDDDALIARIAAGDSAAISELYDRYGRQVYSLAYRVLEDGAAAEDVTQECFVKVWRNATRFDPERGRLATWILHLAYTTAVDRLRTLQRVMPSRFDELPQQADVAADTAGDAEIAVLGAQVRAALMRLPAEQRQAIELAYFKAMSQQEISTLLGIPLGTVKSRLRLGLESLRQFLQVPHRKEGDRIVNLSSH